jgi:N-acetylmuramoyl-L-alanine amidase
VSKRNWFIVAVLLVAGVAAGVALVLRVTTTPHGPMVVIDAGHGGSFSANTGVGGLREDQVNLAIAKRLRKELIARNYRVIMTRSSDSDVAKKPGPSWRYVGAPGRTWAYGLNTTSKPRTAELYAELQARVEVANRAGADVFVSIHNNASKNASTRGTETYAYRRDEPGQALAALVQDAVITRTGSPSRGSHASGLYVCRWTNMPAVLVEGAYFTNKADAKNLRSADFQDRLATGIADGIDQWFKSDPLRQTEPELAGADPATLASAVSAAGYPEGAKVAVVLPEAATSLGPSAAALAARLSAPLLLASASGVAPQTADELRRLKPARVVVLGASGESNVHAIATAIERAVGKQTKVEVVAEKTAQATSALAAGSIGLPGTGVVAIVDAADTAALAALAPYAARQRAPVLLSDRGQLSAEGNAFLSANRGRIKRVLAVGCAEKPAQPEGWPVTAVQSADPDDLAARLLGRSDPATDKRPLKPVVVDARHAPDVFSAAAEAARRGQPLIQLSSDVLGPYSREFLVNRPGSVDGFTILRDAGSIRPVAESALRKSVAR